MHKKGGVGLLEHVRLIRRIRYTHLYGNESNLARLCKITLKNTRVSSLSTHSAHTFVFKPGVKAQLFALVVLVLYGPGYYILYSHPIYTINIMNNHKKGVQAHTTSDHRIVKNSGDI